MSTPEKASDGPLCRVEVDQVGQGKVLLGDADISNHVGRVQIESRPGQLTQVLVGLPCIEAASASGKPKLDAVDAMVLRSLGWTAPEEASGWRVALIEAMGMDEDSAWSEIIERAGELADGFSRAGKGGGHGER